VRKVDADLLQALGTETEPGRLTLPRARALAELLGSGKLAFTRFLELRVRTDPVQEAVVLEVETERPQVCVDSIQRCEPMAAVFTPEDDRAPEVLSLRRDFPLVPHLNLRPHEIPRSLCLSAEPWDEAKLTWTPLTFVERIRQWLSLTAAGALHQDDQPLEPLLFSGVDSLVLPREILDSGNLVPEEVILHGHQNSNGSHTLVAQRSSRKPSKAESAGVVLRVETKPQQHGVIRRCPRNLSELHVLLAETGLDVLAELRTRIKTWNLQALRDAKTILVVDLPKTRTPDGPIEEHELRAFIADKTVAELGVEIGSLGYVDGRYGPLLQDDLQKDGSSVRLCIANVLPTFSRDMGAILNGLPQKNDKRITAIGAGALGSQVIYNLARAGWGIWTIIDHDDLLPHNLARHALGASVVGLPKANALAASLHALAGDKAVALPVVADVLKANPPTELDTAFTETDMILDMAASIAVGRHLASDVDSPARRISVFLNPTGTDLVLLAEDANRSIRLDMIEMQYYRAISTTRTLARHLYVPQGHVRYGQSCRDVSSRMPQDLVALHAGIAARAIRKAADSDKPLIQVWQANPESMEVVHNEMDVTGFVTIRADGWTAHIDDFVLDKVANTRKRKLPDETGGVLIGGLDLRRKTAYIVDVLDSPPDSIEWPDLYVRGWQGLPDRLAQIGEATLGNLTYLGEWHSHPPGRGTGPSADDRRLFGWLLEEMSWSHKPPIMLIVGHDGKTRVFLSQMTEKVPEIICPSYHNSAIRTTEEPDSSQ
jgi:hypothetical protein